MAYKCFSCSKEIESRQVERRVICPYCGSRLLIVTRAKTLKQVKAV